MRPGVKAIFECLSNEALATCAVIAAMKIDAGQVEAPELECSNYDVIDLIDEILKQREVTGGNVLINKDGESGAELVIQEIITAPESEGNDDYGAERDH